MSATVRTTAWTITGGSDMIVVTLDGTRITVKIGCTSRHFAPDALRDVVTWIDDLGMRTDIENMWVRVKDQGGLAFAATVDDGVLKLGQRLAATDATVDWHPFRQALLTACKEAEAPASKPDSE